MAYEESEGFGAGNHAMHLFCWGSSQIIPNGGLCVRGCAKQPEQEKDGFGIEYANPWNPGPLLSKIIVIKNIINNNNKIIIISGPCYRPVLAPQTRDRRTGNGLRECHHGRFRWDMKENFSPEKVGKHWNSAGVTWQGSEPAHVALEDRDSGDHGDAEWWLMILKVCSNFINLQSY